MSGIMANITKRLSKSAHTAMDEVVDGAFVRSDSAFRQWVKADKSTPFRPEPDRYHLYVSYACPWASRCLFLRKIKGLEHVISVSVVAAVMKPTKPSVDEHVGWVFKSQEEEDGCIPDPLHNAKTVREIYERCDDTLGKYTVPILYDKKNDTIVNNESSEIIQMFNSEFNELAKNPDLDLAPEELKEEMEKVDSWIYPNINNGVYRSGFATTQQAYDIAVSDVFSGLEMAEEILSKQRYIASNDRLTLSDVRLFVTLVRFDEVYHGHFKCNKKRIADYPNLENYVRELYQLPGVAETVNMTHIKTHYHCSHKTINLYGIIPVGPGVDYSLPHDRDRFSTKE